LNKAVGAILGVSWPTEKHFNNEKKLLKLGSGFDVVGYY